MPLPFLGQLLINFLQDNVDAQKWLLTYHDRYLGAGVDYRRKNRVQNHPLFSGTGLLFSLFCTAVHLSQR